MSTTIEPYEDEIKIAIEQLTIALKDSIACCVEAKRVLEQRLEEILARPTDPRILNGDYNRAELGDDGRCMTRIEIKVLNEHLDSLEKTKAYLLEHYNIESNW